MTNFKTTDNTRKTKEAIMAELRTHIDIIRTPDQGKRYVVDADFVKSFLSTALDKMREEGAGYGE